MKTLKIKDGVVVDCFVGEASAPAPAGYQYREVDDTVRVGIGWNVQGGEFSPPSAPETSTAEVWGRIKAERDRRTENGGYKVGDKWFHSDQKSRSQQLGLVLLGASIPAGLQWKTMDGSFVTMTQTLAHQILAAAAASDQAIFAAAETHKAAMEASQDPATYDFTSNWPAVFGEE